mgnify:CR=1 FL=1
MNKRGVNCLILLIVSLSVAPCWAVKEIMIFNAKATYPQQASTEIGLILGKSWGTTPGSWSAGSRGMSISVEPGLSGTKLHIGYGVQAAGVASFHSARIAATYLWITDEVSHLDDGDEYAGVEVTGSVFLLCGSFGILRNTSIDEYIATAGIGLGW